MEQHAQKELVRARYGGIAEATSAASCCTPVGGLLIATVLLLEGGLLDLGPAVLRLRDRWRPGQRK